MPQVPHFAKWGDICALRNYNFWWKTLCLWYNCNWRTNVRCPEILKSVSSSQYNVYSKEDLDRKNMALRTNWSCVRNQTTKIRNRYQAIIELVHQFVSMYEVEQQENLILHLEKISRRNIDLSSTIFNRDYNVRLFSFVGRNGNENLIQNL